MVRRSAPQATYAERFFPVRIRIAVPTGGFGAQIDQMHGWLFQHVGARQFWCGSTTVGGVDAMVIYFLDLDAARAFIDRFACGGMLARGREELRPQ